jgi:hypothetical protein
MAKFRAATELAAAEVAHRDHPTELRRRIRDLETRCHQLEDGIRRALVAHAQGSEACHCQLCTELRVLLLGSDNDPTAERKRATAS